MSAAPDGLVELVARALADADGYDWEVLNDNPIFARRYDFLSAARAALAAIAASGTHWVAPVEATLPMKQAWGSVASFVETEWSAMRTAYLAQ